MMGVAVRAKQRAARQGKTIRLVYDSREYVFGQPVVPARIIAAYANLEREFIHHFDQIICVADMMTDQLVQDYHLPQRPALVLNAPAVNHSAPVTPIREVVGLAPDVPLAIYGGGINPVRGIQTAIAALALLPEVHLAVVAREKHWMPPELYQIAEQAGVLERLHVAAFVEHDLVTRYYASADIGLSPLLRVPNHDVTLTNKFCEYLLAGLPIVTSDTPQQAQLVEELDLGAVHRANDPADLARAIRQTLDRLDQLKTRITGDVELQHRFSWEAQVPTLERVYRDAFNKK
jgi:glycosyltransferase involved in cell wall biosynthesis